MLLPYHLLLQPLPMLPSRKGLGKTVWLMYP